LPCRWSGNTPGRFSASLFLWVLARLAFTSFRLFIESGLLTPLKCLENGFISRHGYLFESSTAQNCKNSAVEANQNASFCNAGKKQSGDFPLDAVFTVKIRDTPLHRFHPRRSFLPILCMTLFWYPHFRLETQHQAGLMHLSVAGVRDINSRKCQ
jgi:hypothetical protein